MVGRPRRGTRCLVAAAGTLAKVPLASPADGWMTITCRADQNCGPGRGGMVYAQRAAEADWPAGALPPAACWIGWRPQLHGCAAQQRLCARRTRRGLWAPREVGGNCPLEIGGPSGPPSPLTHLRQDLRWQSWQPRRTQAAERSLAAPSSEPQKSPTSALQKPQREGWPLPMRSSEGVAQLWIGCGAAGARTELAQSEGRWVR